ncbi:MAG: DUF58 domain-containing protein, partial [Planctomycetes bacterium]|nr:DUF58 domain-containing protein [Planctomycetota bacterium]
AASLFSGDLSGVLKGGRIEFAGHKPYSPGDDFRYIDWNAASRSDSLHSKTYFAESTSKIHVWIDTSASMFGKLEESFKLGISLAFLALKADAETSLSFYTNSNKMQYLGSYKNQASIFEIIGLIKSLEFSDYEGLRLPVDRIAKSFGRNSQIILISDAYDDELLQTMKSFTQRNMLVLLLHTLSQEELTPKYFENMLLVDSETTEMLKIKGNTSVRDAYIRELEKHIAKIKGFSRQHHIAYKLCNTNMPINELLIKHILPKT